MIIDNCHAARYNTRITTEAHMEHLIEVIGAIAFFVVMDLIMAAWVGIL